MGGGAFAEIARILMQQVGEYAGAEEILRAEIADRGSESPAVVWPTLAIFRRLIAALGESGGEGRGGDIERIDGFLPR